jgi:hypothetical protein
MTAWPNTLREKTRAARIAAMNGPFIGWLRWHAAPLVQAELGSWIDGRHLTLGEAVFQFRGPDGLAIYERGIVPASGATAIAFEDIIECVYLPLREVEKANHNPQGSVELRLSTDDAEAVVMLPFVDYSNFVPVLSEHARRVSRRDTSEL